MNNTYQTLSLSEFQSYCADNHIRENDMVFWVGCGIDSIPPTNLPLAAPLMKFILSRTCGEDAVSKMLDIWEKTKEILDEAKISSNGFPSIPRLESIMEQLMVCEDHMKPEYRCDSFLNVIRDFDAAPPNKNHFALAAALKKGANIITPNYTSCIQKAYETMVSPEQYLCLQQHIDKTSTYIYESSLENSGKLIFFHGIAANSDNLGLSLRNVKAPLPAGLIAQIEHWEQEGKIFIFCGYSGSDAFDVNRYFISLEKRIVPATGIWIRHGSPNAGELIPTEKEKIIMEHYSARYILQEDTASFLSLFSENKDKKYPDFSFEECCSFKGYDKCFQKGLLTAICSFLGMDVTLVCDGDWTPSMQEKAVYDKWYTSYPPFTMARLQGDQSLLEEFGNMLKEMESESPDRIDQITLSSLGKYKNFSLRELHEMMDSVKKAIKGDELLSWNISTDINTYCSHFLSILMCCDSVELLLAKIDANRSTAAIVKEICSLIIERGYDFVSEMNQIHLAWRDYAILCTLCDGGFENALQALETSTYYYVEVSRYRRYYREYEHFAVYICYEIHIRR